MLPLLAAFLVLGAGAEDSSYLGHGIAMHGDLKYGPDFDHFDYVNPSAPKGGSARLAEIGTFDSLQPFILKGIAPTGIGLVFDTLTTRSEDEPFSEYGLLAQSIEVPADRSWVAYTLRPEARFHDGSPVTAEDVVFTFEALREHGHPFYRAYYKDVVAAEKLAERKVRFRFRAGENRELALIVGQMPVLSKAYWQGREFDRTTLQPPLGSGAYRIESVEPGRSITYRRVGDYWGKDLPVNRGRYNFEEIRYDYYRDSTVALEAFKAGEYDFREESSAKSWATGYDSPALRQGWIVKEEIPNEIPTGMQAFVFNTRRPMFRDPRVRQALGYAFDFEWINKNLFYGAYTRTKSFFSNSELASRGTPSAEEIAILEPFRDRLPEGLFEREYEPPVSDGSGNPRANLRRALELLEQAGWKVKNGALVRDGSAEPMRFEILLVQSDFERVCLPFVRNLKRLGVEARVRVVDAAQYRNRLDQFDFDMIVHNWGQSLSPGNEQRDFWGSHAADTPGSQNVAGIHDPVVDELIAMVIAAPDRAALVQRTHALDRVLLWGHYVIPQWHIRSFRVARWDKFGRPDTPPKYALGFDTWWVDPAREQRLEERRARPDRS